MILLTFETSFSQNLCSQVFEVPYVRGHLVRSNETRSFYFVGEGMMGGRVFRVVDHTTGRSTLYKQYKTEWALKNDFHALRLLKELVERTDNEVQINEPLRKLDDKTLEFPDVRGHTLFNHPNGARAEVWMVEFSFWAWKVKAAAEAQGYIVRPMDRHLIWMEYVVPRNRREEFDGLEKINFFLKPDNVIVDSFTGQMVIFDPM